MNGSMKVSTSHLNRRGIVYLRQSTTKQVEKNQESAHNQRALKTRLLELGWKPEQVSILEDDQGQSATQTAGRGAFQQMVADVGLGKVGIILGYEPGLFIRSVRGEYFRGGKCTGWLGSGGWADRPLSPWGLAIVG